MTDLRLPAFLAGIPRDELLDATYWLQPLEVDYGFSLMEEGDEDPSIVMLLEGEVSVHTDGLELATIKANGVVGEMEMFGDPLRIASVRTSCPSKLLVLDREGYLALREQNNAVAWAMERAVVDQLAGRLRAVILQLDRLAESDEEELEEASSGMWRWLSDRLSVDYLIGPRGYAWSQMLGASPCFSWSDELVIDELVRQMSPRTFAPGDILFEQDEIGDRVYVLVEGAVDVLRTCPGGEVLRVLTLDGVQVLGAEALVANKPHLATTVARGKVLALELDGDAAARLLAEPDLVGSGLRTAFVRALSGQVAAANGRLAMMTHAHRRSIKLALAPLREGCYVEAPQGA